jgi:large subunit ribosomal protein L21
MYAVIKTGGKQYRVAKDDVLSIERLNAKPGDAVSFDEVLMLGGASVAPTIGTPFISGAKVTAEVLELNRGPKLIAFKKRRRKNSRRKKGHRQDLIKVRIMEVLAAGEQASAKPTGVGVKSALAGVAGATSARRGAASGGRAFTTLKAAEGGKADDLSLIGGVGPKMETELHKAGIFHFWQLAGMTAADVAKLEANGDIGPRVTREEWVAQAQELLAGKPPRAKSDRDRADG